MGAHLETVRAVLDRRGSRELRTLLRSEASPETGSPEAARLILDHFRGRTSKGIGWSCGLDESETTLLLGHLRALAGEEDR